MADSTHPFETGSIAIFLPGLMIRKEPEQVFVDFLPITKKVIIPSRTEEEPCCVRKWSIQLNLEACLSGFPSNSSLLCALLSVHDIGGNDATKETGKCIFIFMLLYKQNLQSIMPAGSTSRTLISFAGIPQHFRMICNELWWKQLTMISENLWS